MLFRNHPQRYIRRQSPTESGTHFTIWIPKMGRETNRNLYSPGPTKIRKEQILSLSLSFWYISTAQQLSSKWRKLKKKFKLTWFWDFFPPFLVLLYKDILWAVKSNNRNTFLILNPTASKVILPLYHHSARQQNSFSRGWTKADDKDITSFSSLCNPGFSNAELLFFLLIL